MGFRVRFANVDELVDAYSADVSRGGLFLVTKRFLPVNAVVRVHLGLPGSTTDVHVICRIAYIRDEQEAQRQGKPAGMGVEFLESPPELLAQIEQALAGSPASGAAKVGRRALKVVVVDDDDQYRELAAGTYRARGDDVRVGKDGFEGLAHCLRQVPDVILSDVQMPRMDGWSLLRMVRARPSLSTVPFIFLTTLNSDAERLNGYQLGVDDYIAKPYLPAELVVRVERILRRSNGAASERKSLRGDLDHVGLPSVLSFLELERKTGELLVIGELPARLLLESGRLFRVELDDGALSSKDALARVLRWTAGQFEFAARAVDCADELNCSITGLLMQHAQQSDEENR